MTSNDLFAHSKENFNENIAICGMETNQKCFSVKFKKLKDLNDLQTLDNANNSEEHLKIQIEVKLEFLNFSPSMLNYQS